MACVRKWRGNWVVDWRDPNGKRTIETCEDKDAAERRFAEVIRNGKQRASKRLTFKEYGNWWLENCAKGEIKESTYQEYEGVLRNHVYPAFGSKPFVKINRTTIRELIAMKKKEDLTRSTIRNILAPIRGMYNQAIDDGTVHFNPAARMGKRNKRSAEEPDKEMNPPTREEVQTMLKTAKEKVPVYYPLFLCAPRTGIREGELIALKGIDVDFRGRFIEVKRNYSRGKITLPKNGKTRRVDMSQQLIDTLNELLSKKRAEALRKNMEKPTDERTDAAAVVNEVMEDWLFTTPTGTQLDPSNLRKVFNKLLTDAKVRRVRFHDLRHAFATLLIQQGESLAYVRDQMGHSSIKITVDTYGHLVPGGNRQAVDRLDDNVLTKQQTINAEAAA
jgi:integrase